VSTTLQDRLQDIARRFSGRFALYAKHLDTGEEVVFGAPEPMETASAIKLPVMAAVFEAVRTGRLALHDPVTLTADDQVTGSGVLQHLTIGTTLSLRDVVTLMIVVSDNTATNMVLRTVGLETVNACCRMWGFTDTRVVKPIDWSLPPPIGLSTPRDLAGFLERIHRRTLVDEAASAAMWDILCRQEYNTLLTRRLPYDLLAEADDGTPPAVVIGSKSGSVSGVRNDAGLVVSPWGAYVVAIMSDGCGDLRFHMDNEASVLLPEATRAVFDHFLGPYLPTA
jgi:beta-lactamase class A